MTHDDLTQRLTAIGQGHVLDHWSELDERGKANLIVQLASLDLDSIPELVDQYVLNKPDSAVPSDIQPVNAWSRDQLADSTEGVDLFLEHGRNLRASGKIGAFLVAGGQGTRLGFDGPKGKFPVTPVSGKTLFQVFAEQLLAHSRKAGASIPWYIMTSDANDAETRDFLASRSYFGLNERDVFIFKQGMMPAFSRDGKLLLESNDSLALSPDGHGGSLRALRRSGALDDMHARGVEHLSYFQVDNPLVYTIDPLFIGLHDKLGSEMSSKTISKAHALEKVGNFVQSQGAVRVVEYSDFPSALAQETDVSGGLVFDAGSIAVHILRTSFVARLTEGGSLQLPWHRAEKKVPHVADPNPDAPNAIKLEQFVFDAIPLAAKAMVYRTDRAEEFSPVKNAAGEDSPATCRRDQIRRAARWLRDAGVSVPEDGGEPDAIIEISPLYATDAGELARKSPPGRTIESGQALLIE